MHATLAYTHMVNDQKINAEIASLSSVKMLVETYEIVAATSMRRIRGSVLANREFHRGLNGVFQEVKHAYREEVLKLMQKHRINAEKGLSLIKRNGKTAYVFLSANAGLYGDIIHKTFSFFLDAVRNQPSDAVIVGKVGDALFKQAMPDTPYTYFDFPDKDVIFENLRDITACLTRYEKVLVFHGIFKSFAEQKTAFSNISGDELPHASPSAEPVRYLFEPTLETIALFFETEIFASLLEESFHESRLAKLASRMMLLDRANLNIDRTLERVSFEQRKTQHRIFNKKQLDATRGISLWNSVNASR